MSKPASNPSDRQPTRPDRPAGPGRRHRVGARSRHRHRWPLPTTREGRIPTAALCVAVAVYGVIIAVISSVVVVLILCGAC